MMMMMIVLKNISFVVDKKAELKKLNRSILICFLELLDILIDNPSSPEVSPSKYFQWMPKRRGDQLSLSLSFTQRNDKIKDINVLFINMHHLINEYRPHQVTP